jgi:Zn-finger nucleic acid-binding protein
MMERNQIEIDYCPSCRGVWLDKGELDKMLEYAATQNSSFDPPGQHGFDRPSGYDSFRKQQHGHRKPYKKKSFLGDLFDFD